MPKSHDRKMYTYPSFDDLLAGFCFNFASPAVGMTSGISHNVFQDRLYPKLDENTEKRWKIKQ